MASSKSKQKDPPLGPGAPEPAGEAKGSGGAVQTASKIDPRDSSTPPLKRSPNSTFVPPSPVDSAKTSRESSPIRPPLKPGTARGQRSRKNSREGSPNPSAGSSTHPSASAVQRALSTANTPSLVPTVVSEPALKAPRPQRPVGGMPADSALRWPTSPRLKSPPPKETSGKSALLSPRKLSLEQSTFPPGIVVQGSTPAPRSGSTTPTPQPKTNATDTDPEDQTPPSGIRTPARGVSGSGSTLETVQESSLPATPAIGPAVIDKMGILSDDERPEKITENPPEEITSKAAKHHVPESGSESGGNKSDGKGARAPGLNAVGIGTTRSTTVAPTKPYSTLHPRGKPAGEGSTKNMTVETETVSSIPQVAVGGGAGERGGPTRSETSGSVRQKPSTETIRPKKEKKKARKAPSVTAGTASSKADIFEAKIASAVEADSSDSEEAFVYESNPPEPHPPRSGRYHSRTPSVTSMHSQADQRPGLRSVQSLLDGNQTKRSMKFTNNPYNSSTADSDTFPSGGADGSGTIRASGIGSGRGSGANGAHHHHIGHGARNGRGGHTSIFADESPFSNATKPSRLGGANGPKSASRPNSPRSSHLRSLGMNGNGTKKPKVSPYDMDPDGADDERTPLISSVRINRNHQNRRRATGSQRQLEHNQSRQRQGLMSRLAGCIIFTVMLVLVISGALGFLLATTKPLLDVKVLEINNVLASEQEIMLDLLVAAVNPNVISVTVSDMDVNLFAKSNYLGRKEPNSSEIFSRASWERRKRRRRKQRSDDSGATTLLANEKSDLHTKDDPLNDPIKDPGAGDPQTMLLGRIYEFDSALTFEGSPVQRQQSSSVGEVRLAKPGNKTEAGGSARWERVIQHPFELIVRGVLKYQLPLSTRVRTAPIGASVVVHPEKGIDKKGRMTVHQISRPYPPGSNVVVVVGGDGASKDTDSNA
ncbi:hypothetical protein GP486_006200 [Trichoglossum hirsutum]|uniref:Phospholipid metabolism enzyme regulator n=1 Tax=Trichoglossum hirsutum TaxID=265104 RepID=A0A9P8L5S0_9PEZI|nr:hypothetical protein GP486_006200 [Trichoglossum hirsutum]